MSAETLSTYRELTVGREESSKLCVVHVKYYTWVFIKFKLSSTVCNTHIQNDNYGGGNWVVPLIKNMAASKILAGVKGAAKGGYILFLWRVSICLAV